MKTLKKIKVGNGEEYGLNIKGSGVITTTDDNEGNVTIGAEVDIVEIKGNVATEDDLPTNPIKGDLYYIVDSEIMKIWSGTEWLTFGGKVDMKGYLKIEDVRATGAVQISYYPDNILIGIKEYTHAESIKPVANTGYTLSFKLSPLGIKTLKIEYDATWTPHRSLPSNTKARIPQFMMDNYEPLSSDTIVKTGYQDGTPIQFTLTKDDSGWYLENDKTIEQYNGSMSLTIMYL